MFARSLIPSRRLFVLRSSPAAGGSYVSSFHISSAATTTSAFVVPHPLVSGKPHEKVTASSLVAWKSTVAAPRKRIAIPPNLKIDPRSSFAPSLDLDLLADEDEDETDETRDEQGDDEPEESDEAGEIDHKAPTSEKQQKDDLSRRYLAQEEVAYAVPLPERLHVQVHTLFAPAHSSQVGTFWLEESVFGRDPIRVDLLKRAVDYYRAKKRGRRKAKTKTISEVSGSGRKIRQQKGTGMARAGHSRPPHFRGGAKAHGPKNTTDYGKTKLNKKVRRQALANALSQKLKEGNLIVFDQLYRLETHKTNYLASLLEPWDIGGREGASALILDHYYPPKQDDDNDDNNNKASDEEEEPSATSHGGVPINFWVASRNIFNIKVGSHHAANVYDILKYEKLVLTLGAIQMIERRLKDI